MVAEKLMNSIMLSGSKCSISDIVSTDPSDVCSDVDMLIVMYPVYAGIAPKPMRDYLSGLPHLKTSAKAAVISISGGGDDPFNCGCRVGAIKTLYMKLYTVVYEDMVVMPSNWAYATSAELIPQIFAVLDEKIRRITNDLLDSRDANSLAYDSIRPSFKKQAINMLGKVAGKVGFPMLGKFYKAGSDCTGCGICARHCPSSNIVMKDARPHFGWKCYLCMRCTYICPEKAINAGPFNFMILDEGYDIQQLKNSPQISNHDVSTDSYGKKIPWKSVVKYIEDLKE